MAAKLCELCQKEYAGDTRFGVELCRSCLDGYSHAINGNSDAIAYFSNPSNFPQATQSAKTNIIAFFAERCNRTDVVQQTAQEESPAEQQDAPAQSEWNIHTDRENSNDEFTLDSLYTDIGTRIKKLAKWVFIVEAIATMLGAVGMMLASEDGAMFFMALIALVLGPVLAWVSSWILYAFGELVDKSSANEKNTRMILELLSESKENSENQ